MPGKKENACGARRLAAGPYPAAAPATIDGRDRPCGLHRHDAAGQRHQIFVVLGEQHAQRLRLGQPAAVVELGVDDRIGLQLASAQQPAHLQQAARHVIVVGDQDHAAIGVALHPFGALLGVADRVERGAVDVDAAGKQRRVAAGRELRAGGAAGRRMDAADQQALALAGLEQVEGRIEPRLAAGQHDDRVGLVRIGRRAQAADMHGEPAETAGEHEGRYRKAQITCGAGKQVAGASDARLAL